MKGMKMHEGKPGSAGRRTVFMHFAFGDQRLAVGSRPAGRRRRIGINNVLFAWETRTVPGSPSRPSSRTFFTDSSMKLGTWENLFTTEDTEDTEVKT